jgi:hypothetical protein
MLDNRRVYPEIAEGIRYVVRDSGRETFAKRPLLSPATSGTLGSNFNPQNTQCMDACPDFIGVVNPPEADRLP